MKQTSSALILAMMLLASCTVPTAQPQSASSAYNEEQRQPGDSTIYGLACEGCTDSILVFLPFSGGDPDTFDILTAREHHQVFGRPDIGDELAIVRNAEDSTKADRVINIDRLKGEWCYLVHPRLKKPVSDTTKMPPLPDSLLQKWMQPREYGIEIMRDFSARAIGRVRPGKEDKQIPVEFPPVKQYREWHIFNGHFILTEAKRDTSGNQHVINTDTAEITLLRRDSLRLRFADHEQGYYRRTQ